MNKSNREVKERKLSLENIFIHDNNLQPLIYMLIEEVRKLKKEVDKLQSK